jgi:PAS domain S-box-containing protein
MKNTDLSAEPEETQRVTKGSPVVEAQLVFIPLRMHRRTDGAVFPVEITGRFFTWRERAVHIAAIRDITARLAAEASLKESQQLYHDLVETAQDLIWQCDAEGRYTYLNPAWETVFGYPVEEMLGQPFTQFQSPDYAAQDRELFRQLLTGKTVAGHETIHRGKDGHEIHLVFNAKAIWNAAGAIYGVRGTAYDVSERKRVELALQENNARLQALNAELRQTQDQLVQSQKMESVGRLAAGIAHDFRNILTSIVLYAQMPLRKQRAAPGLPPDVTKALETILSESRRASDLVQQILDFSRRTMLRLRPVELCEFTRAFDICTQLRSIKYHPMSARCHLCDATHSKARHLALTPRRDADGGEWYLPFSTDVRPEPRRAPTSRGVGLLRLPIRQRYDDEVRAHFRAVLQPSRWQGTAGIGAGLRHDRR